MNDDGQPPHPGRLQAVLTLRSPTPSPLGLLALLAVLVWTPPAAASPGPPPGPATAPVSAVPSGQEPGQVAGATAGQEPDQASTANGEEDPEAEVDPGGKRMVASRTQGPPVIDGRVDDDVWELAEVVSDFLQREPDNAEAASERTEVRMLYDDEAIYLGFVLHDSRPDQISATDLQRDSRLRDDDTIAVLFDTFHDHRNGFLFRTNPLGTKYDAQIRNESQVNSDWDEKWEAASRVTERGWEAEMAIPLKALRYPTGTHVWGIDFKREIRRRNEEDNWANYRRGFQFNAVSQMGHLQGLENLTLTKRFRFKPYMTGGGARFNATDAPHSDFDGDIGIEDFKVQLTPNLTADFTVNTDFAQVEDDNERVNLTRFSLFFPEKREFFLESANNFAFGTGGRGMGGGFGGPQINLYHSRNIGLAGGRAVPIVYGAKMTGKVGSANLGLLNVQTDESELGPGENFTALRLKQDVLGRSTIGAIFTSVQGGDQANRVGGIDADFTFFDYLNVSGFLARVDDTGIEGNPMAGELSAGWNSDRFDASGSYSVVQPDFESDLGFITRTDMERQQYSVGWSPRPDALGLRQVRMNTSVEYLTDTAGRLQTRDQGASVNFSFESGDSVWVSASNNFERIDEPFTVASAGTVDAGDYEYTSYTVNLNSYGARRLSGRLRYTWGGYYSGTRSSISPGGSIRINEKFSLSPSWSYNQIELPGGAFDTHTVSVRSAYNFNERWLTNSLLQYNSVSDTVSVFARLNYIYRTGDDVFFVYKQSRLVAGEYSGMYDHSVTGKVTYSFDF